MRGRRRSQELPITESPGVRRRPQRLRRRGFQLRFSALPYGSRSVSGFSSAALALLVVAAPLWAATNPRAAAEANAGLELAREGKYEQAVPHYRAALALDPSLPGLYLNLGLAYFKLNRLSEAGPAFERAVHADPAIFQAQVLLAMTYYAGKQNLGLKTRRIRVDRPFERRTGFRQSIQFEVGQSQIQIKAGQGWVQRQGGAIVRDSLFVLAFSGQLQPGVRLGGCSWIRGGP